MNNPQVTIGVVGCVCFKFPGVCFSFQSRIGKIG